MTSKTFVVLVVMFTLQFSLSSCSCDCPQPLTYRVSYNSVSLTAYNTSGFQNSEVKEDTVHKNSFGIGVAVNSDLIEVAERLPSKASFGFSAALALDCDCIPDEYQYPDPIDHLKIFVSNPETSEKVEVTEHFAIYQYPENELISLNEFFNNREEWHDGFQFQLVEYDYIPDTAIFTVEVYLESGKIISEQTEQINFFE